MYYNEFNSSKVTLSRIYVVIIVYRRHLEHSLIYIVNMYILYSKYVYNSILYGHCMAPTSLCCSHSWARSAIGVIYINLSQAWGGGGLLRV